MSRANRLAFGTQLKTFCYVEFWPDQAQRFVQSRNVSLSYHV
jgi:hypothetical protein